MNCLSSFLQKGVPCHSLGGSSWISQQLLKVMLGLAQNVDRQKNVPASFSIFRFDNGVSMTCHSSTWTYRSSPRPPRGGTLKAWTISAFSAAWHQQARSQLRFYKRLDPLCMWLAIWRTTYSQSGMAQALSLKSMMSHPPRPRWAWPRRLEASGLDPTRLQMPNVFIRCSALNMEWSSRKHPYLRLANCASNKNSFGCHCTNTRQLQHGIELQLKFLGEELVESYLPLFLLVLRNQANWFQSPATHWIFRFRSCFPKQCFRKIPSVLNKWNKKQI